MLLKNLIDGIDAKVYNLKKDVEITDLTINSKDVKNGSLFFCLKGTNYNGLDYVSDAIENGAKAIVSSVEFKTDIPLIVVNNPRVAMCKIASAFYNNPEKKLKLVGVSGTNGKTTTTYIIKKILESAGHKVGLIGTSANYIGSVMLPPKLTTPDPIDLFNLFNQMVKTNCEYVVMEVSAHAIYFKKLDNLIFETMVLSNITQDHLDFFKTFDNYKNTKISFFNSLHTKSACFNMDDPSFCDAVRQCDVPYLSMSKTSDADCKATPIKSTIKGNVFDLDILGNTARINFQLPGAFNISNALQAASACSQLGIKLKDIEQGLNSIEQVKGRFNIVDTGLDFDVVIDYAHTPDGIENIVNAINAIKTNKSILVFGCGGNRDSSKRAIMGNIATKLCDYVVVTSDNPRFEKPDLIIKDIVKGINKTNFETEVDRRLAIEKAMRLANCGDIVIVAGKGCEDYQEINGIKHHFLDEEVVLEIAKKLRNEQTSKNIKRVK